MGALAKQEKEYINILKDIDTIQSKKLELEQIAEVKEYLNNVHCGENGFVAVVVRDKNGWQQRHYHMQELYANLEKILSIPDANIYSSLNSFYVPKRTIDCIRHLNALYLEFDNHLENKILTKEDLECIMFYLHKDYFGKVVPEPSIIVNSGRGIQCIWCIEDLPKQALPLWSMVQNNIYKVFKDFCIRGYTADANALDASRVFRLPQTLNSKSGTIAKTIGFTGERFRLDKLIEGYFPDLKIVKKTYKKDKPKIQKKTNKVTVKDNKVKSLYTVYQLHYMRLGDIIKLQKIRGGNCKGERELMCFLYRYYSCLYVREPEKALEDVLEFNNNFVEPLTETEVIKATASAEKAYKEWESTQELIQRGKNINVYDVASCRYIIKGYNYSNKKLIKLLKITPKEQEDLDTIIGTEEKYKRNNKNRRDRRRNENGLTEKQQELKDQEQQVKKLRQEGLSMQKIAIQMGISKSKVVKLANL